MYQKTTLDNGLRLITTTMPHTRSISSCIFIGVGSRYETEAQAGISHFIEHLCFKGTPKRRTAREVSEAIEGVGGILNGGTDKELTVYWCKVAQFHFPLVLDVLIDILLHSKFDPVDIERERQVIDEEINMSKDSPSQQVNMLIDEASIAGDAPDFVKNRVKMQSEYMDKIKDTFNGDVRAIVPLFETEVQGVEMLKRTAECVFA